MMMYIYVENYFKCKRIINVKCGLVVNFWGGSRGMRLRSSI